MSPNLGLNLRSAYFHLPRLLSIHSVSPSSLLSHLFMHHISLCGLDQTHSFEGCFAAFLSPNEGRFTPRNPLTLASLWVSRPATCLPGPDTHTHSLILSHTPRRGVCPGLIVVIRGLQDQQEETEREENWGLLHTDSRIQGMLSHTPTHTRTRTQCSTVHVMLCLKSIVTHPRIHTHPYISLL